MQKTPLTFKKIRLIIGYQVMPVLDYLLLPFLWLSALWMKQVRKYILKGKMSASKQVFFKTGVFPIIDHFYEPTFNIQKHVKNLEAERTLHLDFNDEEQLALLQQFRFSEELAKFPLKRTYKTEYFYHNSNFMEGDAEYYYSLIRAIKPKKIIEIGSGNSTLMALNAIRRNKQDDPNYSCNLICVEPYPLFWIRDLEEIQLIEKKVEDIDLSLFEDLEDNDILFVDSTHMVRPGSDVLYEIFEIFPVVKKGVYIHIHDVFTPYYYPANFLKDTIYFWDEQYVLEAFLMYNQDFKIIGALEYLKNKHLPALIQSFPMLAKNPNVHTGSFWIRRV